MEGRQSVGFSCSSRNLAPEKTSALCFTSELFFTFFPVWLLVCGHPVWWVGSGHSSSRSIAMSSSDRGGIQALLAAEQDAQRIVANARAAKTARLRQAKEEAEREVAQYRAQREAEFRKKLSDSSGDSGANVKRLESETNDKINRLSDDAAKVAAEVTALLMNYVITVKN
ncbi:V-type proton ATPase subunit G 1 isoform X3 [Physcomitrium patens]|uniref:V-type proton ATPase subunit G 1 isoform X3 n=1 Tax=Physcomitrium patens TaxID=3218 RepID=UPI000D17C3EA|nr:V-type proton ATPase subunit G 1-like isoform X3 [Physcomitrium patens]|eukprot:XP_024396355.1 V-type proton ATPase subunit G 1-like isoform X3 [Physcomitrella patens]